VELVMLAGAKESMDDGAALLLSSCCFFTKKSVRGIAIKSSTRLPIRKNLFFNIFTIK